MEYSEEQLLANKKYLELLSGSYPTIQTASTEIINLRAILNLPKGTEHFISDIHGEYEVFTHILRNASGSIKRKIDECFGDSLTVDEKKQLATILYYPEKKLADLAISGTNTREWYRNILERLVMVCRVATSKYTRSKVRKALPVDFQYIIEELMYTDNFEANKQEYFSNILDTIIEINRADQFIIELSQLVQRMIIDKLHIIGDIFDRGCGAHFIMDDLCKHHNTDFQWGNHDILWMGAACGQTSCIANVIRNSLRYNNFDVLEDGYGINVRPLAVFAMEQYRNDPCASFLPKLMEYPEQPQEVDGHAELLAARMHKAIAMIQFKLEGQLIQKHPEYCMKNRLLLDKIDSDHGTVLVNGICYPLNDCLFPTVNPGDPYCLTPEEQLVIKQLQISFLHSEKLQRHIKLLFKEGSMYKIYNNNLLYHGCIPLAEDGGFASLVVGGVEYSGKALLDFCDRMCRRGAYGTGTEKEEGLDFMWFLWCGPRSPLNGKSKMTTFERCFIDDTACHEEVKDWYYSYIHSRTTAEMILREFGVTAKCSHIVNGHVPVKIAKGESPVKAGGKLLIIDGGISKAYQPVTGISGYTLVSNSHQLVLSEHQPFTGVETAIHSDQDMHSKNIVIEEYQQRIKICDTDEGRAISDKIADLTMLLHAYRKGIIKQIG
ncbi:MAG: fructose-1,6-bisphosphatase [Angelakisella sp.]